MKQRKAFVTGSQAYGRPRPDSDIDIVLWVEPETRKKLFALSEQQRKEGKIPAAGNSCYLTNVNLVLIDSPDQFDMWEQTTKELVARAEVRGCPVLKEEAKQAFIAAGVDPETY